MDSSVRPASESESIDLLSSVGVLERLKVKPVRVENGDTYVVNERMLLVLLPYPNGIIEAHIAEPKQYWKHIHTDIDDSLIFIQSLGYNEVYTNVRETLKTTLNLLKKHDFKHIDTIDSEVILKWESKQHS